MVSYLALGGWLAGAAFGLALFLSWRRADRPPPLVYRHLATASAGLLLWVVYLSTGRPPALAWTAFALLLAANTFGDTLMVRGQRARHGRTTPVGDYRRATLALLRRPRALAHALLAGVTFFSVLLAALGV